jgi:CRP-like cAMP-binding protein
MYDVLQQSPVFKGLSEQELLKAFLNKHHFTRSYQVGEMIALSGDRCNHLMCILEGSVKGEMVDFSGKTITIENIAAPRILALAFLFGKENTFPVNILANERTRILYVPKYEFLKMLQGDIRILENYLNAVSARAQFLSEKIRFLSFKTIRGKIAHYLISHLEEDKKTVLLKHTQQQLSELFGVERPSVARTLGELEGDGFIESGRKSIIIKDLQGLKELVEKKN